MMKNIDHLIEKKTKELILLRRKLFVIEWIEKFPGNVRKEFKEFDIPKSTYYDWRRRYRLEGQKGLERKGLLPNHIQTASLKKLRRKYSSSGNLINWVQPE
jgi:hypothetical protein